MKLSSEQNFAIDFARGAVPEGLIRAILGPAGTGKTTLSRQLYQALVDAGIRPLFVTPSHKAAARARELGIPAATLHSQFLVPNWSPLHEKLQAWIELGRGDESMHSDLVARTGKEISLSTLRAVRKSGSFRSGCEKLGIDPMRDLLDGWVERDQDFDATIIDEAGMVSLSTFRKLTTQARSIILIGDPNQLFPVATDDEMREDPAQGISCLERLQTSQIFRLNTVHRTAEGSGILRLANAVINDHLDYAGVMRRARQIAGECDDVIIEQSLPTEWMKANGRPPVLTYTNKTRIAVISHLRRIYGFPDDEVAVGEELLVNWVPRGLNDGNTTQRVGASVSIEIERSRRVIRGRGESLDSGAIARALGIEWPVPVVEKLAKNSTVTVMEIPTRYELVVRDVFRGVHRVKASVGEYNGAYIRNAGGGAVSFRAAAAMTTHSAQGSEWPAVVVMATDIRPFINMPPQGSIEMWRRWFYTATTRAQRKLVLVI